MITGAHSFIYSTDAEADRAFLRDVLGFPHIDAGGGWLIFALPASELAVHPHDHNDRHEFYLMCDDVDAFVEEMTTRGVACDPVSQQGWGALTSLTLPGGGRIGVYEPAHARPAAAKRTKRRTRAKRSSPKRQPAARRRTRRSPSRRK